MHTAGVPKSNSEPWIGSTATQAVYMSAGALISCSDTHQLAGSAFLQFKTTTRKHQTQVARCCVGGRENAEKNQRFQRANKHRNIRLRPTHQALSRAKLPNTHQMDQRCLLRRNYTLLYNHRCCWPFIYLMAAHHEKVSSRGPHMAETEGTLTIKARRLTVGLLCHGIHVQLWVDGWAAYDLPMADI